MTLKSFIIGFLLLKISVNQNEAFKVTQTENLIAVKEDESLDLSCTGSEAWEYCKWSFYDRACARTLDSISSICVIDENGRVTWKGVPTIDNTCTITINQPKIKDSGSWTCRLIQAQGENNVASKSYKLTVYSKTKVSFASRPYTRMMVGNNYTIECKGQGGVPSPDLIALVGPEESIGENDITLEVIEDVSDGMLGGTVSKLFKYKPTTDFPSMFVKCMAFQTDSEDYNIYEPDVVASSFEVVFPPLPSETPLQTFFVEQGETATVLILFDANPPPTNAQLIWHVVKTNSNQSFMLEAGSSQDRYEALDVVVDGTFVSATLLIHEANFEDVKNFYYLEAMNELGSFLYNFELTPQPVYTTIDNSPENVRKEDGFSIGAIVGIVVGIILALFALFMVFCFLIKKKKCCFSEKESGDEYMSSNQRDNEAHNDNVNQTMRNSTITASSHQLSDTPLEENEGERDSLVSSSYKPTMNGQSNTNSKRQSYINATTLDRESMYPVH